MGHQADVNEADLEIIANRLHHFNGLQVFSDGGYNNGAGSAGVVLVGCRWERGELQREILGIMGRYLSISMSSFETEVIALDLAVELVMGATQYSRNMSGVSKRARIC